MRYQVAQPKAQVLRSPLAWLVEVGTYKLELRQVAVAISRIAERHMPRRIIDQRQECGSRHDLAKGTSTKDCILVRLTCLLGIGEAESFAIEEAVLQNQADGKPGSL